MSLALQKALLEIDALIARLVSEPALHNGLDRASGANDQKPASELPPHFNEPQKAKEKRKKPANVDTNTAQQDGQAQQHLETFKKARLVVGLVQQAEILPNSDKLYKCKVKVGPAENRQIIAGLRKHVEKESLEGRLVTVVLNLKAAKLAGELSEGMILAAVQRGANYDHGELVKPISPPEAANAGDPVLLQETKLPDTFPKEFKQWKKVLPYFTVMNTRATFGGRPLETAAGAITVDSTIPDGATIS